MLEIDRTDQPSANDSQTLPDSRLTTPRDIHTSTNTNDLEGLVNERPSNE